MSARIDNFLSNRWLLLALRVALGGIFIAASVPKLQHQTEFINTVVNYGILPEALAQAYGLVVPWVELLVGCCLVLGIFSRFATIISIPLIASFVVASTYKLLNTSGETCGCFGELIILSHRASLSLNAVMLAMALLLLFDEAREEFLGLGPFLSQHNPVAAGRSRFIFVNASKLAIVVVAMVLFVPFSEAVQSSTDTAATVNPELNSTPEQIAYHTEIDTALGEGRPVFLFFYIIGCPPCEAQHPVIDELSQKYGDRVHFMDVFMSGDNILPEFRVIDSPTMLLVTGKDSEGLYTIYRRFQGTTDIETLRESMEQVLP
jgi:putative oxidoreductase